MPPLQQKFIELCPRDPSISIWSDSSANLPDPADWSETFQPGPQRLPMDSLYLTDYSREGKWRPQAPRAMVDHISSSYSQCLPATSDISFSSLLQCHLLREAFGPPHPHPFSPETFLHLS